MKKLLSILAAMMLMLVMATVAFADEPATTPTSAITPAPTSTAVVYTPTTSVSFREIEKTYTSNVDTVLSETLTFTSTALTSNPDGGVANLTVADLGISNLALDSTKAVSAGNLTVTIPSLSVAGPYEWIIKETAGNTAGVTYSTAEVHVVALVEYDNTNRKLQIASTTSYIKKVDGTKAKTFANSYEAVTFTVKKSVSGNQASLNDEFTIWVSFSAKKEIGTNVTIAGTTVAPSAWTIGKDQSTGNFKEANYGYMSTYSAAGGAKSFTVPAGMTVNVWERNVDATTRITENGYTFEKISKTTGNTSSDFRNYAGTGFGEVYNSTEFVVYNTKNTTIESGITTDSVPYIALLGVVTLAGVAMIIKRRAYNR